jgi:hypothetical protein
LSEVYTIKEMDRGYMDFRQDTASGILLVRWNDNSVGTVGRIHFGINPISLAPRWSKKERKQNQVPVPNNIVVYNKYMGGTDRIYENIGYYRLMIQIRKSWWPVFIAQLSMAMQNAWQLCRLSAAMANNQLDLLGFTRKVAVALILGNKSAASSAAGRLPP